MNDGRLEQRVAEVAKAVLSERGFVTAIGVKVGEARHRAISAPTQRVTERSANGAEQLLKLRGVTGHVV
jgi:hypothetical protein